MTCIIAIVDGQHNVWLAGDSFCGDDNIRNMCNASKVYKVGPLGIGLCGYVRQELIIEQTIRQALEKDNVQVTHDWIKFELPNLISKNMHTNNAIINKDGQSTMGKSSYLIAFDGRLYYLDDDFGIWETSKKIAAIGAGKYYALGALQAIINSGVYSTPEQMLLDSLKVSCEWSNWVVPPYTTIKV